MTKNTIWEGAVRSILYVKNLDTAFSGRRGVQRDILFKKKYTKKKHPNLLHIICGY
jgi:hypothetical protein